MFDKDFNFSYIEYRIKNIGEFEYVYMFLFSFRKKLGFFFINCVCDRL